MVNKLVKRRTDPIIFPLVGWLVTYLTCGVFGIFTENIQAENLAEFSGLAIATFSIIWCTHKLLTASDNDRRIELKNTLVQIMIFSIILYFRFIFLSLVR